MPEASATAQITVKYCNPQKPDKKNASIKTIDNQLYFVSPEMYPQFEEGSRYNIEYTTNNFKGVQYRHIVKIVSRVASASPPLNPVAQHNAITKATYGKVDMETAERIFVCGAINAMLSNQNTLPFTLLTADIVTRVNILRDVWRSTFANPQQNAELDDEIPFP